MTTTTDLNALSGRERDADLARRLFGPPTDRPSWWWWKTTGFPLDEDAAIFAGPQFHARIESAWLVVEEMRRRGYVLLLYEDEDSVSGSWEAVFTGGTGAANTAPEAICRAALLALGEEGRDGVA